MARKNTQGGRKQSKRARMMHAKLALGGAAATAMYLSSGAPAQAAIVYTNTPLSIGLGDGLVNWDVDGNATADFRLETFGSSSLSINGGGAFVNKVGPAEDGIEGFNPVASQFDVGPNMPAGYFFGANNAIFRTMMVSSGNLLGPDALGWAAPTQYVGFTFNSGGVKYGWASVTLDTVNAVLKINEWAYDNAGAAIHLGAVPEPATAGLALLACGAAGLRNWRRRRAAK